MTLTIILPDVSAHDRLAGPLAELGKHGLTHDFAIVAADGTCAAFGGAAGAYASVHEIVAPLNVTEVALIRLSLDGDNVEVHRQLIDALRATWLPRGINVTVGSVTVPKAGAPVSTCHMSALWDFNIVVVPEDSQGAKASAPRPVSTDDDQTTLAVAAVACLGGLWRWLREGVIAAPHSQAGATVRLARLYTRMVDAGNVADRAMAIATGEGVRLPAPSGFVYHEAPHDAAASIVNLLAPVSGASPLGFSYVPPPPPAPPRPVELGPLQAIRTFVGLVSEEMRPVAEERAGAIWNRFCDGVESAVQNRTFGADGDVVVRLRRPSRWSPSARTDDRNAALATLQQLDLLRPEQRPKTWELYVRGLLGIADGSSLPPELGALRLSYRGSPAVVQDLNVIAHPDLASPAGGFRVSAEELAGAGLAADVEDPVIGPVDVVLAQSVMQRLIAASPEPRAAAGGPSASAVSPPKSPETGAAKSPASTEPEGSNDDVQEPLRSRLSSWVEQRRTTIAWQLAERLVAAQERALDDLQSAHSGLEGLWTEIQGFDTQLAASGRKIRRRALWLGLAVLVLLALTVVGFVLLSAVAGAIAAVALVGAILLGSRSVIRVAAERVRLNSRLEQFRNRPADLAHLRQHAASSYATLGALYDQYQEWAAIVGSALHRPWGSFESNDLDPWSMDSGVLSFAIGTPQFSELHLTRSALGVAGRIRTPGWITKAYLGRRERWLDNYSTVTSMIQLEADTPEADAAASTKPIFDLGATVLFTPRVQFRRDFVRGAFANEYRHDQAEQLGKLVAAVRPTELVERVNSPIKNLNGATVEEFLSPIVTHFDVPSFEAWLQPHVVMPVESSFGVSSTVSVNAGGWRKVPTVDAHPRLIFAAFRLDLTDSVRPSDTTFVVECDRDAVEPPPGEPAPPSSLL